MLVYNSRLQFIIAEKSRRKKKKLKAAGNMHPQSKAKRNEKIYQIQFSEQLTNNLEEDS